MANEKATSEALRDRTGANTDGDDDDEEKTAAAMVFPAL